MLLLGESEGSGHSDGRERPAMSTAVVVGDTRLLRGSFLVGENRSLSAGRARREAGVSVRWLALVAVGLLLLASAALLSSSLDKHPPSSAALLSSSLDKHPLSSHAARPAAVAPARLSSLPLTAQGVISATLGDESRAYRIGRSAGGYRAVNPAQRLSARFDRAGVLVQSSKARLGLRLSAVGRGASLAELAPASPQARDNRVVYARARLSEWYANGPLGLEQGFTLARAPAGGATGPLTLALALSGDVRAAVNASGRGLTLAAARGSSLRYDDLLATDARGRALHSWITLQAGRVLLHVDDRGARYPLRIDPLIQQGSTLTGSEEPDKGEFGYRVAISSDGNTALIGGLAQSKYSGAAWVFTRSGGVWTQQGKKLTGGEEETSEGFFGCSVALSSDGNTALIGGSNNGKGAGAVWVFTRSEGKWTQQGKKLVGGEEETGESNFGISVALSSEGNTALIGAYLGNAVWVFTRSEGKWTQQGKKLTTEEVEREGTFGYSVALSSDGNTALIGGYNDNKGAGSAWVFTRSEGKWTQQGSKLTGEENKSAGFGISVALSSDGNTALIGGLYDSSFIGAAWVFTRSEGKWTQQGGKLTDGETTGDGEFGGSVALTSDGNTALIGAGNEDAAWVFTRSEGKWALQGSKLTGGGHFGWSVALSSEASTALVGSPLEGSGGTASVFVSGQLPEEKYGSGSNPSSPNVPQCQCGKSVNGATGNENDQQTDISIGGRGPGLRIVRSYNGLAAATAKEAGPWGYGWTGPYDAHLEVNSKAGTATVHQENGSTATFYKNGETYTQAGWTEATLVKEGVNYLYTLPDQRKLEFNSEGRLTKETERNGNANTLAYNGSNQLKTVTDGDGRTLTFKYDGEGQVESVTDPMEHVVSYTYASEQLASVTIEGKMRWEFEYESPHLLKKIIDGRKHATTIVYDSSHRVIKEVQAGHERKWKYSSTPGAETTLTEPNGSETVETFDAAGEPTKVIHAKGTSVETTTEFEYNPVTLSLTRMIDPAGHETTYGYDAEDNKISETDPSGDQRKWTYDHKHEIETETTPEGETKTIKLNGNGDIQAVERPIGKETQKTEYKYNEKGDLIEAVDPLKHVVKYAYDAAGDRISSAEPEKVELTWKYDPDSQVVSEINALGNNPLTTEKAHYTTKIERDQQGRPIKITDGLGHVTEYKYDADGNLESVTDGNKHTTKYEYNEENLPIRVEEPNKTVVETGYDAEGQPTSRTDGNKHVWEYKRNPLEQVAEEKNPLGKVWKSKYEKDGNLESLEDPEHNTTQYAYDASDRLKAVKYSTGKPSEVIYAYNKDGKITQMKDGTGTTTNTYDKLDRLVEVENGARKVVKYEYDLDSRPLKITYPNGKSVTREYDNDGRLVGVTDWNSKATRFSYNLDSTLLTITFPTETGDKDERRFNETGRLLEIKMTKGTESLGKLLYARGNDAEVTKTTSTTLPGPEVSEDKYDENSRLTEDNKQAYEYDSANNPTKLEGSGPYTYNSADELEEGPAAKYTFNEDARRTESKPKSGEPATAYGYDQAGNLTSVERAKGAKEPEIKDAYTYNGANLRQRQTTNGVKANLTWDTAEPLPLVLEDETNSYIYGPENLPLEQIPTSGGETLYFHHDQQGSTRLLTDKQGKTVAAYTFNPYGALNASSGTASTPLRYDGQYTNTDSGLIYLRARSYDPGTAQFLSVDPELAATHEPYAYAKSNPLNESDPSGHYVSCVGPTGIVLPNGASSFSGGSCIGSSFSYVGPSSVTLPNGGSTYYGGSYVGPWMFPDGSIDFISCVGPSATVLPNGASSSSGGSCIGSLFNYVGPSSVTLPNGASSSSGGSYIGPWIFPNGSTSFVSAVGPSSTTLPNGASIFSGGSCTVFP
jgi:RHS repeat-associated protein